MDSLESKEILSKLHARLPELEWKISVLGSLFSFRNLPKGLFRLEKESSGAACVAEIKSDIQALSQQENQRSAFYLAERIRQKVNVLVVLCQIHKQRNKPEEKRFFGVEMLSSRQQRLHALETEVNSLLEQQQAMIKTLERLKHDPNSNVVLHLKADLGEIERRLTLAKEALNRAIS